MYVRLKANQPFWHFAGSAAAVGAWPQDPNEKKRLKNVSELGIINV
jgi:hypothetical protein